MPYKFEDCKIISRSLKRRRSVMSCKYIVKLGDSLSKIAKDKLGDHKSAHELATFNGISISSFLKPGQELKLPYCMYTVKKGDSLWKIAGHSISGAQKIARFNHRNINDLLPIGTTLLIPFEIATPKTVIEGNDEYIVQQGDTLFSVAQNELGLSARHLEIARLNNVRHLSHLSPGQVLKMPPTSKNFSTNQDESVRPEVKECINKLIPDQLDKTTPTLEDRLKRAAEIYIQLLIRIQWLEGSSQYMYLDGKGLVTIGLGFNIDNKEGLKRDFENGTLIFYQNGKQVLNFDVVERAYDFVKKQRKNLQREKYYKKGVNDLLISKKQMIEVSEDHLKHYVIAEIKNNFPNLDKIANGSPPPIAAIVGMMDKIYNAGMKKLKMPANEHGFPKFLKAFREGDFIAAAKESGNEPNNPQQKGILKRNTLDYELFMKAAKH